MAIYGHPPVDLVLTERASQPKRKPWLEQRTPSELRAVTNAAWQREWDTSDKGRYTYGMIRQLRWRETIDYEVDNQHHDVTVTWALQHLFPQERTGTEYLLHLMYGR